MMNWSAKAKELRDKAVAAYAAGNRDVGSYFSADEVGTLRAFGARPMEFYDFAEDAAELDWETALLITSARRDYFLVVQNGAWSDRVVRAEGLPPKTAELDGIAWLPRLIAKAEAKLRGELADDLMYSCRGDRRFFTQYDIHPADFLRLIWAAAGDAERVVGYVKHGASR